MRRGASILIALACSTARESRAQSDLARTSAAKALYESAVADMDAKDYESACPKIEEALRLEPGAVGAKLTLAECYEGDGRLASAWTAYALAEEAAAKASQAARQKKAHERAAAVRPRLATLAIVVPDDLASQPDLAITRDGVPVGRAQWGVPLPADKGSHALVVTAGNRRFERTFEVLEDGIAAVATLPESLEPRRLAPARKPAQKPPSRVITEEKEPMLRVFTDAPGVALHEIYQGRPSLVCSAPCVTPVSQSSTHELFFSGNGISESAHFNVGRGNDLMVTVSPGNAAVRVTGITLFTLGSFLAGGSLIGIVALASRGSDIGGAGAALGVGLGTMLLGVPFWASGRTTFSFRPGSMAVSY